MLRLNKLRHVISENLKRGEERKRKHGNHSGQSRHQQVFDILESACRLYRQLWSCGSKQYTGKKTIKEEILRVTAKKYTKPHVSVHNQQYGRAYTNHNYENSNNMRLVRGTKLLDSIKI